MADGSFPTLVSKDTSSNAVANPIWIQLTDGTTALSITSNALDVNVDNTVTVSASNLDIRDLVKGIGTGEDNVLIFANTVKDGSGTDYVPLVDGDGQLQVDVLTMPALSVNYSYVDATTFAFTTDYVAAIGGVFDDTATNVLTENDIGHVRVTEKAILLTTIADPTTDTQRMAVNVDGSINVNVVSAATVGEIHDYATTVDTGNNDYTVAGTTFLLKSVIFAASGGMKATVQAGPLATLVTIAVGFIAHQGGTEQLFFDPPVEVPVTSTGTVRVIMTNREGAAQSLYSTIIGNDIP